MRLFLVGPRACGKTTVGRTLARELHCGFFDTDREIVDRLGCEIADYVAAQGWDAFRDRETEALESVLAATQGQETAVISTGGGIVLRGTNRDLMREAGLVLYLNAPVATLCQRLSANPQAGQRPTLTGAGVVDEVAEVVAARDPLYRACAHRVLDATLPPARICENVRLSLGKEHV